MSRQILIKNYLSIEEQIASYNYGRKRRHMKVIKLLDDTRR